MAQASGMDWNTEKLQNTFVASRSLSSSSPRGGHAGGCPAAPHDLANRGVEAFGLGQFFQNSACAHNMARASDRSNWASRYSASGGSSGTRRSKAHRSCSGWASDWVVRDVFGDRLDVDDVGDEDGVVGAHGAPTR